MYHQISPQYQNTTLHHNNSCCHILFMSGKLKMGSIYAFKAGHGLPYKSHQILSETKTELSCKSKCSDDTLSSRLEVVDIITICLQSKSECNSTVLMVGRSQTRSQQILYFLSSEYMLSCKYQSSQ